MSFPVSVQQRPGQHKDRMISAGRHQPAGNRAVMSVPARLQTLIDKQVGIQYIFRHICLPVVFLCNHHDLSVCQMPLQRPETALDQFRCVIHSLHPAYPYGTRMNICQRLRFSTFSHILLHISSILLPQFVQDPMFHSQPDDLQRFSGKSKKHCFQKRKPQHPRLCILLQHGQPIHFSKYFTEFSHPLFSIFCRFTAEHYTRQYMALQYLFFQILLCIFKKTGCDHRCHNANGKRSYNGH